MCGIVGIAGDLYYKEEKTMQGLLLLDYFRGMDSTGLAAVRNSGEVVIAKGAFDPITLFQMTKFKNALNGNTSKAFIGHNRASTSGSTNNYNAHPFQCGHITGVMNGTLETADKKVLQDALGEQFEVDSEALFAAIEAFGVKEAIGMVREGHDSQRGAWALVWHDESDDTINFLRNQHRPLWLGWDEGFKRLFFASQWQTLSHGCEFLSSYKFEKYERQEPDKGTYRFFQLPINQHVKFTLDVMKKGSKERPKPVVKEVKGKEPYRSANASKPVWDPFQKAGVTPTGNKTSLTSSTTTSHLGSDRQGQGILHLFGSQNEPYSRAITEQEFSYLVQENAHGGQTGCSWCFADIPYGTPGITVYHNQDTILCPKCSGFDVMPDTSPMARVYVDSDRFSKLKKAA